MSVIQVNSYEELKKRIADFQRVVVSFGAESCGSCGFFHHAYESMAAKRRSIKFISVDLDKLNIKTASSSSGDKNEDELIFKDIDALPTFFFYESGQLVCKDSGTNLRRFKENLDKLISLSKQEVEKEEEESTINSKQEQSIKE